MYDRETFGPLLRAERERRGISLDTIAAVTKVSADLWEGLERNEFSRWPSGIFARAFVRDYARAIGLDADEAVDEFCRLFPIGDRRTSRLIRAQAELLGHQLLFQDAGGVPVEGDRRTAAVEAARRTKFSPRSLAAAIDLTSTLLAASLMSYLLGSEFWASTGLMALAYYGLATVAIGVTPGTWGVEILRQRMPELFTVQDRRAHA